MSLKTLEQSKDTIAFLLSLFSKVETWSVDDIDDVRASREKLEKEYEAVERQMELVRLRESSIQRRRRWMNTALYALACLNIVYLLLNAPYNTIIPKLAICFVFLFALLKAAPGIASIRAIASLLLPLVVVLVLFSISPLRDYLHRFTTDIAVLGLLYAIVFALQPAGNDTG